MNVQLKQLSFLPYFQYIDFSRNTDCVSIRGAKHQVMLLNLRLCDNINSLKKHNLWLVVLSQKKTLENINMKYHILLWTFYNKIILKFRTLYLKVTPVAFVADSFFTRRNIFPVIVLLSSIIIQDDMFLIKVLYEYGSVAFVQI